TRALAQFGSQADRSRLQGASLTERVRWYQQVRGLAPDGIAGTMTLMQLGVDLDGTLPLLTPTARVPTSIQGG
ncbi:MAG: peptidoglycan-binding protein, partial [Gammaproteobacteria bacterium]|nr:peptidoglycan-binding protein [Gammaproteobacteria bacterium]